MPSLFDPQVRTAILGRVSRLTPERKPVWGRFTAPEMVCHVSSGLRQGLGELDAGPPSGPPLAFAPTRPRPRLGQSPELLLSNDGDPVSQRR